MGIVFSTLSSNDDTAVVQILLCKRDEDWVRKDFQEMMLGGFVQEIGEMRFS